MAASLALLLLSVLVGWFVPARVRLAFWTAVVIAGVVPWLSWVGHSHWDRVQWVPLVSPPIRVWDNVLNIILYLPLGFFFVRGGRGRRVGWAVLYGLLLSLATETTQVFGHGRFPSMTDVCTNVIGAWAGALVARRGLEQRAAGPSDPA